jgi:hypothetical protein
MPSPDANRVRIIGEELCPELECPQDPLPEKLKMLLELFDAAQWHYHRTPELQGPTSDDRLHVEVERDDLLVTLPGTSYAVKWCKLANQLDCKEYPMEVDRRSPISQAEFIGKAWRMANEKARGLGWIR